MLTDSASTILFGVVAWNKHDDDDDKEEEDDDERVAIEPSKWNLLVIVSSLSCYWSMKEAGKEATRLRSYIPSTSTSTSEQIRTQLSPCP